MKSIVKLLLLLPLVLCYGCSDDDPAAPTSNPNKVWFEDATGEPGDQVTMDIMIHNAEPIIFVQLPFSLEETACQVTDFAFAGSFASPILSDEDEDSEPCRYNTWAVVATPLDVGDHLYATITFTIDDPATAQSVSVQGYEYIGPFSRDPGNNLYRHYPNFGTMSGKTIPAAVTDGALEITQPAP
jgi:hypothetical protein